MLIGRSQKSLQKINYKSKSQNRSSAIRDVKVSCALGVNQYDPFLLSHKSTYLRPVIASNNLSSAFHILPTDPNNFAIRSPSSSVADAPKLMTIEQKNINDLDNFHAILTAIQTYNRYVKKNKVDVKTTKIYVTNPKSQPNAKEPPIYF